MGKPGWEMFRRVLSEFVTTTIFLGTLFFTLVNFSRLGGDLGSIAVGLVVGTVATTLILCFRSFSAQFNPAITLTLMALGRMDLLEGLLYIVVQICAGMVAGLLPYAVFPKHYPGGPTIGDAIAVHKNPAASTFNAFLMELVLTMLLLIPVCFHTEPVLRSRSRPQPQEPENLELDEQSQDLECAEEDRPLDPGPTSLVGPVTIGITLGFLTYLGGLSSGGSFNPARAFGASVVSGHWDYQWLYWVGPVIGGPLGGFLQDLVFYRRRKSAFSRF